MDEVEKLLAQVKDEIRLDAAGHIHIAPTAPARFHEREDIELAHKYHSLFDKPHVIEEIPQNIDVVLEERLQKLGSSPKTNIKINTSDKQNRKSQKAAPTSNSELAALWSQFRLSDLSDDYEVPSSDEEFDLEDDEIFEVLQSCVKPKNN